MINKFVEVEFFDGRFDVVLRILATTQEVAGSIPAQCKHLCA
jgi:hypothetical protein